MSSSERAKKEDYSNEIKCMMYSFGDSRHPNPDTMVLIEQTTHAQLTEMIIKATDVARLKGKKVVNVEDILFLLRKNNRKLRTILKHLKIRDIAKTAESTETEWNAVADILPPSKKRKSSLDFLNPSEQANVDTPEQDLQILKHMDEITKDMDATEYIYYTRCRRANFHKNTTKLKNWLNIASLTDFRLTQEATEVFGYLAYETVKEIVELSLQVRQDNEHALLRPCFGHTHHPCTPSQFGTTPTFFTTPTTGSTEQSLPIPSPSFPPSNSPLNSSNSVPSETRDSRKPLQSEAIHPKHVREALRRYSYELGPMSPLTTHLTKPTFYKRTLCT